MITLRSIFLIIVFSISQSVFSESLSYDSDNHTLKLKEWSIPSWIHHVVDLADPKTQYAFISPHSNYSSMKGWYPVSQIKDYKKKLPQDTTYKVPEKLLQRGWFYSQVKVDNAPSEGWFYSIKYHLYFNLEGIQTLNRYFQKHLSSIQKIQPDSAYYTQKGEILRISIKLNKNIDNIELINLPYNWVCMYESSISENPNEKIFVIQSYIEPDKRHDPQTIKVKLKYLNKQPLYETYKLFFYTTSQALSDLEF